MSLESGHIKFELYVFLVVATYLNFYKIEALEFKKCKCNFAVVASLFFPGRIREVFPLSCECLLSEFFEKDSVGKDKCHKTITENGNKV